MIKSKKELLDHCLKQVNKIGPYTFEHYVLMQLLDNVSDEEFERICDNFKYIYFNE